MRPNTPTTSQKAGVAATPQPGQLVRRAQPGDDLALHRRPPVAPPRCLECQDRRVVWDRDICARVPCGACRRR